MKTSLISPDVNEKRQ